MIQQKRRCSIKDTYKEARIKVNDKTARNEMQNKEK